MRGHKSGEWDCVTETGHCNLPDEQGNANNPVETGSGQKTATDHGESDPAETSSGLRTATDLVETTSERERDKTDSGQKTVIGLAATDRGKTATETSHDDYALNRLTASGKRSESASAETGHESGLYDPS